jgi:hypothetical protein
MRGQKLFSAITAAFVLAACLFVVGCHGKSVEGSTYGDPSGAMTLTFKDGKATLSMIGQQASPPVPYEESGDKVTIHASAAGGGGDLVLIVNDDGSLQGPMGKLVKKTN